MKKRLRITKVQDLHAADCTTKEGLVWTEGWATIGTIIGGIPGGLLAGIGGIATYAIIC